MTDCSTEAYLQLPRLCTRAGAPRTITSGAGPLGCTEGPPFRLSPSPSCLARSLEYGLRLHRTAGPESQAGESPSPASLELLDGSRPVLGLLRAGCALERLSGGGFRNRRETKSGDFTSRVAFPMDASRSAMCGVHNPKLTRFKTVFQFSSNLCPLRCEKLNKHLRRL